MDGFYFKGFKADSSRFPEMQTREQFLKFRKKHYRSISRALNFSLNENRDLFCSMNPHNGNWLLENLL